MPSSEVLKTSIKIIFKPFPYPSRGGVDCKCYFVHKIYIIMRHNALMT